MTRKATMDITYKEFNEQMDFVGIAITEVLNDKADNISRVSVAAALIEVLSDLVVYDRPDGQDKDLPEEWVFAMLKGVIDAKKETRDGATIN
tara:strand:- start:189 stop:464 length:276 start_codon:yes stop_codon:yes gene_type:complete